jgi:hypothetical protein
MADAQRCEHRGIVGFRVAGIGIGTPISYKLAFVAYP